MSPVRFLTSDDRALFAECGNVLVGLAMHQESPGTFALGEGHLQSLIGRHPRGVGFLFLVDHAEGPPPGFLERMRAIHLSVERELVGVSCVILPEGFAASIYRSTAAAFIALTGTRSLLHMAGDVETGASWLGVRLSELPGAPASEALATAAGELLRRREGER